MDQASPAIDWIGPFTDDDRSQIERLREGQLRAIQGGDADAYTALCAADVCSMLPRHDAVLGREAFHDFQKRMLGSVDFTGMRKLPIRVERSGDLAVEIGRQSLPASAGTFAKAQKYVHVMRKTSEGWRFVVLASNPSG